MKGVVAGGRATRNQKDRRGGICFALLCCALLSVPASGRIATDEFSQFFCCSKVLNTLSPHSVATFNRHIESLYSVARFCCVSSRVFEFALCPLNSSPAKFKQKQIDYRFTYGGIQPAPWSNHRAKFLHPPDPPPAHGSYACASCPPYGQGLHGH